METLRREDFLVSLNARAIDLMRFMDYNTAQTFLNVGLRRLDEARRKVEAAVRERHGEEGDSMDEDMDGGPTSFPAPVDVSATASAKPGSSLLAQEQRRHQQDDVVSSTASTPPSGNRIHPDDLTSQAAHSSASSSSFAFELYQKAFTIASSPPGTSESQSSAGPPKSVEDSSAEAETVLDDESDSILWSCILLYNLGLCHQIASLVSGDVDHMTKSLLAYQRALTFIYPWPEDPSFLLLELALLNNNCLIQYQLQESEEISKCLQRIQVNLRDIDVVLTPDAPATTDSAFLEEIAYFRRNLAKTQSPPQK
uniref:Uncharacterized protein n=1 Tax=Entomoneis paludosa TaxID=265537 RepID=A0A7S2YMP8_9STRA|mmetsp:Transcript_38918/g.80813  ORF Transcript_38918/g.80813 Transcript_38918/m.80813 type:complete len:311 (+) Transcript_38918:99-1031(+)